ncbi:MAG TPA: choice-of-anchor J domain-containing protein [Candidatus Cloacimonadota bacterium]|nr:choice-of-anchor J domain-containing protein [Candidatus Cloacimonadota bacterium]
MKKFLALFLLIAIASFAFADVYTIGTGTTTQNYIPNYGLYDYSWSKTIYTATEINTAGLTGPASLVGIGYDVGNTPANYTMTDQRVYVRQTTASVYATADNNLPDNTLFTQVYQGNYTYNGGGWHYVMFSAPFAWDGTSNIEILWENWDGSYTSGYPNFRYTTTTPEYRAVYKYADDAFPTTTGTLYYNRPNIQFATPQLTPPNPAVAIYPTMNGYAFTDAILSWQSGGGMPNGYNVYLGTTNPPTTMVSEGQAGTTYTPANLLPATTYYWQVIPYNSNGPAADCPVWSFTTPGAEQLAESFNDTTWPPPGWANPGTYTRSTTLPFHGAAGAYKLAPVTPALLSTPMVTITTNSTLNFWARTTATTGNGRIQIQYSPDRVEWTNVGDPIALPTVTTWNNYVVDLGALAGNNYYLAFASSSVTSTTATYIDHVFGPNLTPLMPGPVTLAAPADAAINQSVFPALSWTAGTTGGVATSYKVYLDTNPNPTTMIASVPGLNYTVQTALQYLTTYYWKVVASNAAGDAEASAVRSFTTMDNPTISTFPWNVNFGTVTADWPVLNWTQLNGLYPTPTGTTAQWFQDDWLNSTTEPNKAAKINIYGTARNGWLVTPPIAVPAGEYQLRFDAALLVWNGTTAPTTTQDDDRFMVIMSDTPNMANPVILREWNNTGSPYVFNSISHTGTNVIIPLTGITGTKYFAFYGESTVTGNGDNDLMVDNVYIGLPPVDPPVFAVTPASHNFGQVDVNTTSNQVFTISNTGGGNLGIVSITIAGSPMFTLANLPTLPATVTTTPITFGVNYTPTAGGEHAATVTITDNLTRVAHTVQISGTGHVTEELNPPQNLTATVTGDDVHLAWLAPGTPPAQFTDDFESYANFATTFAPWTLVDVDQSTTYGFTGITFPNSGTAMSYIVFNPSATTPAVTGADAHSGAKYAACFASTSAVNNDWMISPLITPQAGDFLSFWARSYVSTYGLERFKVGISTGGTAPANFTIISGANYVQAPVAWTQYTYDLSAYVGQSIRFAIQCLSDDAFIFFVDDVAVGAVPVRMDTPAVIATERANGVRGTVVPNPVEIVETSTETRSLLGYKVYRGGTLINTISNPATLAYDDNNLNPGTYAYTVSAYYTSGESVPAGPVSATIAGPAFSITPTDHNFGNVVIGQTASQTFTVTNTGYGNLIINSIALAGSPMMTLSGLPTLPATLVNGATFTFNASFAPTAAGVQSATITLVSNLTPANYTVALTGTGSQGEVMDPPLDLAATVVTNDVSLTWTSPVPPLTGEWITWSNDVLGNSIGTNAAANFDVAQRWTQADLAAHQGGQLAMVKFVPSFADCVYTLKVWTGGTSLTDPGTLVYSQVINPFIEDDWNLVILDNPIPIPTTGELRIGYNVNTTGGYPAGCDSGPVIEGKGNAMYFNNAWTTLTALAPTLTYNWLIQGFVADGPALKAITPPAAIVETPVRHINTGVLALEQADMSTRVNRALLGYKVYRDNVLLGSINDPAVTTYQDMDLPNGDYLYGVTAVYSAGESVPTTLNVTVNYQLPPVLFQDDFETHPDFALTFAPWTLLDVDQSATYGIQDITFPNSESPMAYIIFNPAATTPPITGLTAYSGAKMAAAFASTSAVNNDWMITPRLRLGTSSTLRFYAKSHTAQYGLERFRVGVSTLANPIPQGFQYITGGTYVEAPTNWTEYIYDLSNYDGQTVFIGIRCVSDNAFVFYVDKFSLHTVGGSSNEDPVVPVAMNELKGNYPNPFNPETTIRYSVKDTTPVMIEIYNVRGQLVKTLVNDTKAAGEHTVVWKGLDENNKPVPSGVYFYKMNAGKYSSTKKMIMMK